MHRRLAGRTPAIAALRAVLAGCRLTAGRVRAMLAAVTGTADHVRRNRAAWDRLAAEYAEPGLRMWAEPEPTWGIWNATEAKAGVLAGDLEGRDSIELGCGTGYVQPGWPAGAPARPGWTTPRRSWPPPASSRTVSGSGSRWYTAAPSRHRSPTPASTWRSPSTAPASGATPTPGSRRRPGCCAPAVS